MEAEGILGGGWHDRAGIGSDRGIPHFGGHIRSEYVQDEVVGRWVSKGDRSRVAIACAD